MEEKRAGLWKVRPMPIAAMSEAAQRLSDLPFKRMSPQSGRYSRLRQLNNVVFPAPFGPISPAIRPLLTVKLTFSSATMPPNRIVSCAISSKGAAALAVV